MKRHFNKLVLFLKPRTAFVHFHTQTAETSIFTTNPACSLVFLNWIINKHHQDSSHAFAKIIVFKQTPILIPGHVEVKENHREISIPKCSLSNRIRALKSSSNRVTGDWRVVASAGDAGKPVEEAAGGVGVVAAASAVGVMEWFCRTGVLW
jgi:hypothetical protein